MNKSLLLLIIMTVGLTACNKRLTGIFRKDLEVDHFEFEYLSAKAKIHFEDTKQKINATAQLRVKKDSVIWMSVTPGLGIEAVRVLINRDSVFFMNRLKKKYTAMSFEGLSRSYNFDFNYDMVESIILGNLIYPYNREIVSTSNEFISYTQQQDNYLFDNFIGVVTRKLEKLSVKDLSTNTTVSVNYGNFQLVNDKVFPHSIEARINYIKSGQKSTLVEIGFNKTEIEDKPLKFPFNVPSKYSRQ
ncbi:MAG: DUF4292 domain-containing protein [Cyclobacteriaceae bacterium]|nr:DUF4292 domain-containing protein [Cyclobacteriaceae bacterium HetDA_MAG_MS6]